MNNKFDRFKINNFVNKNIHIVSAMPSLGKSTYSEKSLANPNSTIKAIDLESSDYKWNIENGEKVLNPDFPNNYIESILLIPEISPEVNVVFVACHSEVRLLLDEIGLDYTIIVPSLGPPAAFDSSVSICIANENLSETRQTTSPNTKLLS